MYTERMADTISDITIDFLREPLLGREKTDPEVLKQEKELLSKKEKITTYFLSIIDRLRGSTELTYISSVEFDKYDLTRHLTLLQRKRINDCGITVQSINEFVSTLNKRGGIIQLSSQLKNLQKFPILSLFSYIKKIGKITQSQVTSICLLWGAIEQLILNRKVCSISLKAYSLVEWDVRIEKYPAKEGVSPNLSTHSMFFKYKKLVQEFFELDDNEIREFVTRLKRKSIPDSERYFHLIEMPAIPLSSWSPACDRITKVAGGNFFKPLKMEERGSIFPYVMFIPSFTMYREFLTCCYKNNAITPLPVLSLCPDIEVEKYKHQNKRVISIGMPQAKTKKFFEGDYCGLFGRSLVDMCLSVHDSCLEKGIRRAIYYIVESILKYNARAKAIGIALMKWQFYVHVEKFSDIFNEERVSWDSENKERVLKNMALLPKFWEEEFGITSLDLSIEDREFYDTIIIDDNDVFNAQIDLFEYYKTYAQLDEKFAYRLGYLYFYEKGTGISYEKGSQYFLNSRIANSLYNASLSYMMLNKITEAFNCCLEAEKLGNREALIMLGVYYLSGQGVSRNTDASYRCFWKAARLKFPSAYYNLCYWHLEVDKNEILAWQCLKIAANMGHAVAQFELGNFLFYDKRYSEALHYFKLASAQGHKDAATNLAIMYQEGRGNYDIFNPDSSPSAKVPTPRVKSESKSRRTSL